MQPNNLLLISSDEHQRDITGRCGNDLVETPHLEWLAQDGFRFALVYTPCPICVQARARVATEQWVLQAGAWDKAAPLCGGAPSRHSPLRDAGHEVTSIGKLHVRGTDVENGFTEETHALPLLEGMGDLIRDAVHTKAFADQRALIARYGRREAVKARRGYSFTPAPGEKPVLVVSA